MIELLAVASLLGPFAGFVLGFFFGQRSVRLMPMRTETLQVSERLTVQRMVPEPEAKAVPVTRETLEDTSVTVPPQYRAMAKAYLDRQAGVDE